jgi:hypothetical protein
MRHITTKGSQLIKQFEGFSSKIYLDSAGFPTIGYGHLLFPHEKHLFQHSIIKEIAETLLKQDVAVAENAVIRLINIPLNNNQFDYLIWVQLHYNDQLSALKLIAKSMKLYQLNLCAGYMQAIENYQDLYEGVNQKPSYTPYNFTLLQSVMIKI